METFISNAWPVYTVFAVVIFIIAGGYAISNKIEGYNDDARRATFWAASSIVWPLVLVYFILKYVFLFFKTAYEGARLIKKGK